MIVKREFIPFRTLLLRHDPAGLLFKELVKKAYPEDMWDEVLLGLSNYALYQRDMSWGFRGIGALIDGFNQLDIDEPYDTGYALCRARHSEIIYCDDNKIKILLKTDHTANADIVGLIEVCDE